MEIQIKNMVCDRCIKAVQLLFESEAVGLKTIQLGVVKTLKEPGQDQIIHIKEKLLKLGFEWLDDGRVKMVEKIKQLIIGLVQEGNLAEQKQNLSQFLARALYKDYHSLSAIFSAMEPTTIEQYFILQKIVKVKEWLVYDELNLSEISFRLGYSSVAHLSAQFKKVTGLTPTQFRQQGKSQRLPLDKIGK